MSSVLNGIFRKNEPHLILEWNANRTLNWWSSDNEDAMSRHTKSGDIKNMTEEQRTGTIEYKFNEYGFRGKSVNEVDDNFMMAFGCSETAGVGSHYKDIWCSVLADELDFDLVNLGMQAHGLPSIYINSVMYLRSGRTLPKLVAIQIPELVRGKVAEVLLNDEDDIMVKTTFANNHVSPYSMTLNQQKEYSDVMFDNTLYIDTLRLLWESAGVPTVFWAYNHVYRDLVNITPVVHFSTDLRAKPTNYITNDFARDLAHMGPKCNSMIADKIKSLCEYKLEGNETAFNERMAEFKYDGMNMTNSISRISDPYVYAIGGDDNE